MKRLLSDLRPSCVSPLQLSVYCRICIIFFFMPFLFFLDVFTTAFASETCRHDNGTGSAAERNQSEAEEVSEAEDDWWKMEGGTLNSVCGWTDWLCYGQTLFSVGLLLGSLVGGAASDRYGKRLVLLVCVCIYSFCGLVPAVLPQLPLFLAVRCLSGVSCCCINICAFSLVVEWTPPSARLWPPAFLPLCFSLGTMGGAPLAWLSSTWTHLHLAMAVPQLVCLPLYLSIPESPSWLLLKRKMEVLDGYRSNSTADKECLDLLLDSASSDLQKAAEAREEMPAGDHARCDLRHPTVLLRLFIMSYLSAASALTYFGICMNIGSFGVSVYSAQFFSGLSEAPCLLIPLVRLGRRPTSMLALLLSGAACFMSLLMSRYDVAPMLVMTSALLGKLCILAATFIGTLYSIELFPTVVRQRCISLVNLCFRLGCIASTLVPQSSEGATSLALMVAYSSGPIIGCALCLLLPETSDIPLPDTVEDCVRQPRPPSMHIIWRTRCFFRKLMSTKSKKTQIDDAQTPDTQKGLI